MAYLDAINSPDDIKKMTVDALEATAAEIREAILKRNSLIGGHVASNLGIVEITLALHYVFDAPRDKIIFDVSHQSYAHKMITGRKEGFLDANEYAHISGFANPQESDYDPFYLGHTSTSISLASGLAKARDLNGEQYNIIAVIGDGALSGGEAFEGLNFAGSELNSNLIIVVNDNEMSIAENHGGLYENLRLLRETNGTAENNFFKTLGFDYTYIENGHNIEELIAAFKRIKNCDRPMIMHIHTLKGKGYSLAEQDKEAWHKHLPFNLSNGEIALQPTLFKNYNELTIEYLNNKFKQGDNIAIITAGMPASFGFKPHIRQAWGERYIDVGIAEEHAIAMTSAMAKAGCRPIFCVGSTFIQRAYDQLSQDLALNQSPAVILVYGGGLSSIDVTHLGIFDMAMMSSIPNLCYFSPAFYEEYVATLDWALAQNQHPVVIRVPAGEPLHHHYNCSLFNAHQVVQSGQSVAIITDGHSYQRAEKLVYELKIRGITPTLINAHYLSHVDKNLLQSLVAHHQIFVTLEDGVLDGGFGEKVARFLGDKDVYVLCYGADKVFTNRVPMTELLSHNKLNPEQIAQDVMKLVSQLYGANLHLLCGN